MPTLEEQLDAIAKGMAQRRGLIPPPQPQAPAQNGADAVKALLIVELMKNGLGLEDATMRAEGLITQAQTGSAPVTPMDEKMREATDMTKAIVQRAEEHDYSGGLGRLDNTNLAEYSESLRRVQGTDLQESTEATIAILRRAEGFGTLLKSDETNANSQEYRTTGKWPTVRKSFGNQPQDHSVTIAGSR